MSQHQPPVTPVTTTRNSVAPGATTRSRNGPYLYRAVAAPGGPGHSSRNTHRELPLANPFYQRASQRLIERGHLGGQHRSPATDRLSTDLESLIDFERERAELADAVEVSPW